MKRNRLSEETNGAAGVSLYWCKRTNIARHRLISGIAIADALSVTLRQLSESQTSQIAVVITAHEKTSLNQFAQSSTCPYRNDNQKPYAELRPFYSLNVREIVAQSF